MQPDQTTVIVIVAAILVAALILWFLYRSRRTAALRERFGEDEYDRTLEARGARGKAEDDLLAREKRHAKLDLRPLGPDERRRFTDDWHAAKHRFVDDPAKAVLDADRVIGGVMGARGYPVDDFDARYESLTVDHGEVARHYRAGHDIALAQTNGTATTEDLRQAMIHYEELFSNLAQEGPERPEGAVSRQAQAMR
ncbi:hypothetical protein [Tsuneonella amylolytica]|uniref:hypothetical protein n=1 Tax=Tsuneonella amylolytica TaxID=2338327 RepID=UPI001892987B|nr:hypothetical protein [Tsuneonella amylolytica]